MNPVIVLDAGPLSLVTNPRISQTNRACNQWLQALRTNGIRVIIPEIADYELRRELLRANKSRIVTQLDQLEMVLEYLPLNTLAMRQAAEFWANVRQLGQPTAGDVALDADVILAAQAVSLGIPGIMIATTNVGHLSRFVTAELWQNIPTS